MKGDQGEAKRLPADLCVQLVDQFDLLGWDRLESVSPSLREFDVTARDPKGRVHVVHISLPQNFPQGAPTCKADLPGAQEAVRWDPQRSTLRDVLAQFERSLLRCQEFWDLLDELDSKCQVLEPENPPRGSTLRRISLGSHCSVQIEIDPDHPRTMPEVRFMGSDAKIAPLKKLLNKNMRKW